MSSVDQQQQEEWIKEQLELKTQHIEFDDFDFEILINPDDDSCSFQGLDFVGGVDISFVPENEDDAVASLVVLNFPELE
ncbi:8228_t:CDS:2, partial [Ambispora gerdemannii]